MGMWLGLDVMNLRLLCFVTLVGLSMLAGNGCGGSGKANRADAPTLTDAPSLPDTLTDLGTGGGGVAGTSGRGGKWPKTVERLVATHSLPQEAWTVATRRRLRCCGGFSHRPAA